MPLSYVFVLIFYLFVILNVMFRDQGTGAGGNFTKLDISLAAQFSDHESQVRFEIKPLSLNSDQHQISP